MDLTNPFILIGAWIIGVLVSAYIFRVVFRIEDIVKNQQEIRDMLREIAGKLNNSNS